MQRSARRGASGIEKADGRRRKKNRRRDVIQVDAVHEVDAKRRKAYLCSTVLYRVPGR